VKIGILIIYSPREMNNPRHAIEEGEETLSCFDILTTMNLHALLLI